MTKEVTIYYKGLFYMVVDDGSNLIDEITCKLLEYELDNNDLNRLVLALIDCNDIISFLDRLMNANILRAYKIQRTLKVSESDV